MLERRDRQILDELQRDSRLTMQELGERVGMSSFGLLAQSQEPGGGRHHRSLCRHRRIIARRASGCRQWCMCRWRGTNRGMSIDFIREVLRHPEVLECFATSGEADFHLRVVVEDIDAYNTFLDDFIFKLPGVSQVRSNIVLKEIKADTALPFRL